jgi:hypothetical protein
VLSDSAEKQNNLRVSESREAQSTMHQFFNSNLRLRFTAKPCGRLLDFDSVLSDKRWADKIKQTAASWCNSHT